MTKSHQCTYINVHIHIHSHWAMCVFLFICNEGDVSLLLSLLHPRKFVVFFFIILDSCTHVHVYCYMLYWIWVTLVSVHSDHVTKSHDLMPHYIHTYMYIMYNYYNFPRYRRGVCLYFGSLLRLRMSWRPSLEAVMSPSGNSTFTNKECQR